MNTFEYYIKSYLASHERFYGKDNLVVEPRFIYVNGIRFKAQFADQFFIDTTLKGKKSLFTVEHDSENHITGDIFLLPSSKNLPIELPNNVMHLVERFVDQNFKLAI
ncbi:MAG: hypothetical protein JXQ87_15205 [Bacteroidia bacterium]